MKSTPRWRPILWRTDGENNRPSLWMQMLDAALSGLGWAVCVMIGMSLMEWFF